MNRIYQTIENMQSWSYETLESIKFTLFFVIVVDVFGVWWFLELKRLGSAIMVTCLICLGVILWLQMSKDPKIKKKEGKKKMTKEITVDGKKYVEVKSDKKEKPEKEEKEEKSEKEEGFDLNLPSGEEMEDRLSRAFGSGL